jgi:O-antigen/teichoic acid export membrane protein
VEFLVKSPEDGEINILTNLVKIVSLALVLNPFGAFFTQQFIIKGRKKIMLQIILFLGIVNIALVIYFIPDIYLVVWAIVINRILAILLNGYFSLKE